MKNLFYALVATSPLALACPAAAQGVQGNVYGTQQGSYPSQPGTQNRVAQLDARLEAGVQTGTITRAEARPLRQQIRQLARLEQQYAANGINQRERQDLQSRLRTIRKQLRAADGGANGRYADWDNDNYANDYGNGSYNNGGYNNDGSYNNGGYNNAGGYNNGGSQVGYRQVSEVCGNQSTSGGIGAILGSILGGSNSNCLRVGDRINGQLSAVPSSYQSQFRNGNGFYYGYLSGNVVEVRSENSVVSRIFVVG
jgi:hypothetical protein